MVCSPWHSTSATNRRKPCLVRVSLVPAGLAAAIDLPLLEGHQLPPASKGSQIHVLTLTIVGGGARVKKIKVAALCDLVMLA